MEIAGHTLSSPHLWLGHDIKQGVMVWEHLSNCPGVMLNAYHIFRRQWFFRQAVESGLAEALRFHGPVFLDSGGYLFQTSGEETITTRQLIDVWNAVRPTLAAILDIPFSPSASNRENSKRWRRTVLNTQFMHLNNGSAELCPVVHSYSLAAVDRRCEMIRQIISSPRVVCVGSLVPLIQGRYLAGRHVPQQGLSPVIHRWRFIGRLIRRVRQSFPHSMIHVFGAGSLSTMYLLYLLGVDSLDSTAWRIKAAFGEIQLPGTPNRCVSGVCRGDHNRKGLSDSDRSLLAQCECPACMGRQVESRTESLRLCYRQRAIHNAFTFISEVQQIRVAKRRGRMASFVEDRLRSSPGFLRILNEAVFHVLEE